MIDQTSTVDPSASVDPSATVGAGTRIWGLTQVREDARIGEDCVVGRGVYVGPGVVVGDRAKIQNLAQVYEPAQVGSGAFIGPGVILTNDQYPRAVTPTGELATAEDWTLVGVTIEDGASIGARSVCVAPVRIGRWAMVAAGSTVVSDVPDHALVAGAPARVIGWVGRAGRRLVEDADQSWRCPVTGERYRRVEERMEVVES